MIKINVYKCKLSEVACLAQQSARVLAARNVPLPRRLRQRSRLIDNQTRQATITKTKQANITSQSSYTSQSATAHTK